MATSDYNFRAITLPGVGELTAYSLGTQSVFNANTPATFYRDALSRLGAFFQQPSGRGQVTNPQNEAPWRPGMPVPPGYRVTTIRGRQVLIPIEEGQATPSQEPDVRERYPSIPLPPPGGSPNVPGGASVPGGTDMPATNGDWGLLEPLRKWFEETDAVTRGVLVLIAIVLLAIGVISLR